MTRKIGVVAKEQIDLYYSGEGIIISMIYPEISSSLMNDPAVSEAAKIWMREQAKGKKCKFLEYCNLLADHFKWNSRWSCVSYPIKQGYDGFNFNDQIAGFIAKIKNKPNFINRQIRFETIRHVKNNGNKPIVDELNFGILGSGQNEDEEKLEITPPYIQKEISEKNKAIAKVVLDFLKKIKDDSAYAESEETETIKEPQVNSSGSEITKVALDNIGINPHFAPKRTWSRQALFFLEKDGVEIKRWRAHINKACLVAQKEHNNLLNAIIKLFQKKKNGIKREIDWRTGNEKNSNEDLNIFAWGKGIKGPAYYYLEWSGEKSEPKQMLKKEAIATAQAKAQEIDNDEVKLFKINKNKGKMIEVEWQSVPSLKAVRSGERSSVYINIYNDGKNIIRQYLGEFKRSKAREIAKMKKAVCQDVKLFHLKKKGRADEISIDSSKVISKDVLIPGTRAQTSKVSKYLFVYKDLTGEMVKDFIGSMKKAEALAFAEEKCRLLQQDIHVVLLSKNFEEKTIGTVKFDNSQDPKNVVSESKDAELGKETIHEELSNDLLEAGDVAETLNELRSGKRIKVDLVLGGILKLEGTITLLEN